MTDYTDLIARLRKYSKRLLPCTHEAADALEAQARRIAELEVIAQFAGEDNARAEQYAARIAELEAALRPFADRLNELEEMPTAAKYAVSTDVAVAHLRAARAALGETK